MAFADYLTTEGKRMMAKAALGYKITCTKLVMGSSMMSANQEESTMSGVITPVIELPIDEVYMNGDDAIVMSAQFSNEDIATGFFFREKGVYMSDGNIEVLAIYANAGYDAEYIDVASKSVIIKKRIRTVMTVTSDELVNIQIVNGDYASAYVIATESTLAEYIASHDLTEFKPGQSVIVGGKKYTFIGTDPKRESDYVVVPVLSDEYEKLEGNATDGVGASQAALYNCYAQMKKSFQAGVDTIYNAFVAVGTTPDSITPDDIAETVPKLIDGTAQASHVLKGKSFSANGEVGVVGTMPDLSGTTADASSVTSDDDYVYATPQEGYYDASSMIRVPKDKIGGAGIIYLGTGTTFDLGSISGYENLTTDNFLVVCDESASATKSYWINHTQQFSNNYNYNTYYTAPVKNYDSTTGVLTITQAACYATENAIGHPFPKTYPAMKVYLVTGEITTL